MNIVLFYVYIEKKEYIKFLSFLIFVNLLLIYKLLGSWINGNWIMSLLMNCNN